MPEIFFFVLIILSQVFLFEICSFLARFKKHKKFRANFNPLWTFSFVRPFTTFILCQKPILCQKFDHNLNSDSIKLKNCVQTCPNCSGFDLCGCIRLRSPKHFIILYMIMLCVFKDDWLNVFDPLILTNAFYYKKASKGEKSLCQLFI